MGRLMMSYMLDDEPSSTTLMAKKEPVEDDTLMPDIFIEKWSASNAFDPDSDEFWNSQEIIHEAFIDVVDMHDRGPSSPEPMSSDSSDDGHAGGAAREMSAEEREVARRAGDMTQRRRAAGPIIVNHPMQIIRSMSTVSDATVVNNQVVRATPRVVYQTQEPSNPIIISPEIPVLDIHPSTPPYRQGTLPELWSDLRHLSRSPIPTNTAPLSPSTPQGAPSPAPSVTPHIYTWDRPHYGPPIPPTSPSPSRALPRRQRATPTGHSHRRRESLPASVSLRG